ncbi:MAG: hypothetical protein OXI27_09165 [Thaumarchaeota archaeon]|nr:hypothetical protein [Nitrososphaerota archaeon]
MGFGEYLADSILKYAAMWFVTVVFILLMIALFWFLLTFDMEGLDDRNEYGFTDEQEERLLRECFGDGEYSTIYTPDMYDACMRGDL